MYALALTKDGKYCLTGGRDRTIRLYNPRKDQGGEGSDGPAALLIKSYAGPHGYEVLDLAVSGDNSKFASAGGDRAAFVWDVTSGNIVRRLQGHLSSINAIAANDDFTVLITGSYDRSIKAWDLRAPGRDPIQQLSGCTDSVSSLIVEQGDRSSGVGGIIIAGCVDRVVRTYDLRAGRLHEDLVHAPVTSVSASSDGACMLVSCLGDGIKCPVLRLLKRQTGVELNSFQGHVNDQYPLRNCFGGDDSIAISGSEDGRIIVWDVLSAKITHELKGHSKAVCAVARAEDGILVSASHDGTALVWS